MLQKHSILCVRSLHFRLRDVSRHDESAAAIDAPAPLTHPLFQLCNEPHTRAYNNATFAALLPVSGHF